MSPNEKPRVAGIDPVTFEVLRNAFMSVVDEMGLILERAAHSLIVSEGRDFSAAICDHAGRLVTEGNGDLPAHVGTVPHCVKAVIRWIGEDRLAEGDIIVMNDPFLGGTHAQDVRLIMPIFHRGELVAFIQNSAHWSDLGGPVPGSFNIEATSTYGEALYIPPIHLVRGGELDDEVLRFILRNIRVSEITQGDVLAQVAVCRTGENRLHALIEKYGLEIIKAEMEELHHYSESLLREEFRQLPDGTYSFEDALDFDPAGDHDKTVSIRLDITIEGGNATYDLSRSDPQTIGALNATESMAQSALVVATKAIFPHIPANEGIYRAITTLNPEGLVTNARFPAAVSAGFVTSYETILACVLGCYLQMLPSRSMACSSNLVNMVIAGSDPRLGHRRDYVMYLWQAGGLGARPGKKDNFAAQPLASSGTRNEPVEVQERLYPILTHRYEFVTDTAGAGRHRGGIGIAREVSLTHDDAVLCIIGNRNVVPVWGWEGGHEAPRGSVTCDGTELGVMRAGIHVKKGALLRLFAGGGGGWEDPLTRPIDWVLTDVVDGFVSLQAAREVYGVVIRVIDDDAGAYEVDADATDQLRATRRAATPSSPPVLSDATPVSGPEKRKPLP